MCVNYLQCVYIEIMEALWYRPFTHYEQIPIFQPKQLFSRNNPTKISGAPLGVVICDSVWRKALGTDHVFSTLELSIIFTDSSVQSLEVVVVLVETQLQDNAQTQ